MQVSDEYELDSIIEGRWLQIEGIDLAARALGVTNALMPRYSQGRMYTAESVTDYAHLKYADRREREERDRKRGVRKAQV